jgi:ribosomal protein S18 acetylase RimI-like enzyme
LKAVPAGEQHVEGIVRLWEQLAGLHAALDPFYATCEGAAGNFETHLRQAIAAEDFLVLACISEGTVVGYALSSLEQHPPVVECRMFGHIDDLVVDEAFRRRGAGTLLVSWTIEWFEQRGIDRIELEVAETNGPGLAFWRTIGFTDFQRIMVRRADTGRPGI